MKDRRPAKRPLYRSVNTRTHGVRHGNGGKARWDRNTKAERNSDAPNGSMHGARRHGRDYTPLYQFLLSKVGRPWSEVYSEAVARLDDPQPVFWMVATNEADEAAIVRTGESSYFSGLKVDEGGALVRVDPDLSVDDLRPTCPCCTHTFNGERFTRAYDASDDRLLGPAP